MDKSELIAQFCAITAADTDTAEQYLEISDNDLENAITLFLESGGASLDSQVRASEQSIQHPTESTNVGGEEFEDDEAMARRLQGEAYSNDNEEVRERIRPVTETLVAPEFGFQSSFGSMPSVFGSQLPRGSQPTQTPYNAFEEEEEEDEEEEGTDGDEYYDGTPGPAHHQRSILTSIYRPPLDIIRNFDLDLAKDTAQAQKKWLLVNIQNINEFACMILNRDVWSNEEIKRVITDNFVFVQYNHDSPEGQEYKQYYPFSGYPHISILDPRTGEQLKTWPTIPGADVFVEDLLDFLNSYSLDPNHRNPPSTVPAPKKDASLMSEEDQIKYALRASLGKKNDSDNDDDDIYEDISDFDDQFDDDDDDDDLEYLGSNEKGKGTVDDPVSLDVDEMEVDHTQIPPAAEEDHELTPEEIFASIPPVDIPQPPPGDKESTRIQFRLADGSRIVRRFKLSNSVRDIFSVVKEIVEGARYDYFSLTSERKKLIDMLDQTIEQAGLKNSSILVEILED